MSRHADLNKLHETLGKRKTISHITEIPVTFNCGTVFGMCGLLSGMCLVLVPKRFMDTEICVPFPSIHDAGRTNMKLIALFAACSASYGYIGGKVYVCTWLSRVNCKWCDDDECAATNSRHSVWAI